MSSREVRVCWETPTYRCVLFRVDGRLELRLSEGERTTRVSTCRDLVDAEATALQWQEAIASP
jgi:hypothetical protein